MTDKLLFLVLWISSIMPMLYAAPTVSSEESSDNSNEFFFMKQLAERFKLLILSLTEICSLFQELSAKCLETFKAVLKDPNVLVIKTKDMENYLEELEDYIAKFEKVKENPEMHETFDMFAEFSKIVDKFDRTNCIESSAAVLAIEKSLNENGLNEIQKLINKHFESLMKRFNAEVVQYFGGLNEKERKLEQESIKWFDQLKAATDALKTTNVVDNNHDNDKKA